ncbi:MAG: phosphoglycerate dehydrogenase [Planctomycetota bacterium]
MKTSFPKDKIRVVLLEGVHDAGAELLAAEGFDVVCEKGSPSDDRLRAHLSEAHLVGIRSKTQLRAPMLTEAGRLLSVGCFCIGTNQVDLDPAALAGVPVFNAPYSNTRSVAELTIAEIVMLSRRTFERSSAMHEGRWIKSATGSHEIRSKTLGIVGYGHIGSQVSVLAEAMGMRVVYYDSVPKLALGNAIPADTLDELLGQSDFVTLHVPATATTEGMIGAHQIAKMKPGAHLINNARGSIVDIDALAAGLKEGRLGGAAVDVFPDEPAGKEARFESPLLGLANVILTPHIGGSTQEAQKNIAIEVATKLVSFVNTGATTGAVNVPNVDLPDQASQRVRTEGGHDRPHRILHFHRNVPGVMGKLNNAISELGVNVSAQHLQTMGEIGYVVLDIEPGNGAELRSRLDAIEGTIRTRMLW